MHLKLSSPALLEYFLEAPPVIGRILAIMEVMGSGVLGSTKPLGV